MFKKIIAWIMDGKTMSVLLDLIKSLLGIGVKVADEQSKEEAIKKAQNEGAELVNKLEAEKAKVAQRDKDRGKTDAEVVDEFINEEKK